MSDSFDLDGKPIRFDIRARRPALHLDIDGVALSVHEGAADAGRFTLDIGGRAVTGWRVVQGDEVYVRIGGRSWTLRRQDRDGGTSGAGGTASLDVRAEMPGTVVAVHARPGDQVAEGDRILTIESMKLQMTIVAHREGRIAAVSVAENDTFERNAVLARFAADPLGN